METIRIILKNDHNWISPSLSEWRVLMYRTVTVLFDQAVEAAKLLYIHASALLSRTFRSSATPELAPNIIAILPVVEKPLQWRADEATFFSANTVIDELYLYASSDGHTELTTKFSIIIDLEITRI